MLETLYVSDFSPYIGQTYEFYLESAGSFNAELIEVNLYPVREGAEFNSIRPEPFSLVFRGPGDQSYPQGMYQVKHKDMKELQIFLVPIGPDKIGFCYEAVFN